MATNIDIINNAFIQLGEAGITSLDDDSVTAEIASALYTSVKETALCAHPWKFASKYEKLSRLSTNIVGNPYDYTFQLPSDFLRMVGVRGQNIKYQVIGDKLVTNELEMTIAYTYNVEEIHFPAWFVKYVQYKMAAESAIPIAQSVNRAEFFEQKAMKMLYECRILDTQDSPKKGFTSYGFVRGGD